jgi:GT2 family glycosyltransferase
MSTLAIIAVVYRNYDILEDYLSSLEKQKNQSFHLYMADLSENKKPIKEEAWATVVSGENKGYAHGVNRGLAAAIRDGHTRFAIMNSDTYMENDFVDSIQKSIEEHPHTLIGGKIYYAKGYEYHKDRYDKKDQGSVLWYAGGTTDWNHATTTHRGVDEVDTNQYDKEEKTDFITGCFMCFDREVCDTVGPWDEKYFLYYEDADWGERAKRAGIPLVYDPSIVLWHKNAQSTDGSGSPTQAKYQKTSRLRFGLKYAPLRTKVHLIKNMVLGD